MAGNEKEVVYDFYFNHIDSAVIVCGVLLFVYLVQRSTSMEPTPLD